MSFLKFVRKNLGAFTTAFQIGNKIISPGSPDELSVDTLQAMNTWFLGEPAVKDQPFPDLDNGDRVLSDAFELDGWGWVWNQRQFVCRHRESGIESRWLDGRTAPMM